MDVENIMKFQDLMNFKSQGSVDFNVVKRNGISVPLDSNRLKNTFLRVAGDKKNDISLELLIKEVLKNSYDGMSTVDLEQVLILSATAFIERDPAYDRVAAGLLLQKLIRQVCGKSINNQVELEFNYRKAFVNNLIKGVEVELFDKRMLQFDLDYLASKLVLERDNLFNFIGINTLYSRYFAKINNNKIETPQAFWMRIAIGLSINEANKEEKAIEFYNILSQLQYISSTPTLFHAGFPIAQLSSCFLTTVNDDLGHIFKCIGDNAQLAKWAGGLGGDWTNIRGTGAYIKKIKATSQGVIPYLKIANDVVVAITKSGIRRGGTCVYLESWHFDIEDFLDLKRNTGDERRRTHDMNIATWVPDLFVKRAMEDKDWTLFSPDEVPDLHHLYGAKFEEAYVEYEKKAKSGGINLFKVISAKQLWRKMLTRLFETGHPWITFKDPCNVRSPQDHVGVVHSSNLCTEITLNTSEDETAVCNLGSINISRHISNGKLDEELLKSTVKTAVRMLDNVIDLNFYPVKEAENSNLRHRPIGLGLMGFQDALYKLDMAFDSDEAKEFADTLMEKISYYVIDASSDLSQERGAYSTFKGSKWDRGIFPLDTIDLLEKERNYPIECSRTSRLDWASLKKKVKSTGMRNSNTLAIAPTATISTIAGCYPSIEPIYENIYVESNVSGEFTIVNKYLVEDLKKLDLWNQEMLDLLKFNDGDIANIPNIPENLKAKYKTVFELDAERLIEITAERGKWIDQAQSHNIFSRGATGAILDSIYRKAWRCGLKTTYYLRTLGASQIEKSTLDAKQFGYTQKRNFGQKAKACGLDPDCESCQ